MLAEIVDPIEEHLGLPINATASVPKTCLYSSMVLKSLFMVDRVDQQRGLCNSLLYTPDVSHGFVYIRAPRLSA